MLPSSEDCADYLGYGPRSTSTGSSRGRGGGLGPCRRGCLFGWSVGPAGTDRRAIAADDVVDGGASHDNRTCDW